MCEGFDNELSRSYTQSRIYKMSKILEQKVLIYVES